MHIVPHMRPRYGTRFDALAIDDDVADFLPNHESITESLAPSTQQKSTQVGAKAGACRDHAVRAFAQSKRQSITDMMVLLFFVHGIRAAITYAALDMRTI